MDVLRELSDDELAYIIARLEENLPFTIKDVYYIKSALKCREEAKHRKNLSDKVLPQFYTHFKGKREHCTIFGITGENNHTVWYFSFDESLKEIRECLDSKLIKWGTTFLFETIHVEQISSVLDYANEKGLKIIENEYAAYYTLSHNALSLLETIIPPHGTFVRQLESSDAEFCNNLWIFKDEKSELWIRSLLEIHGGYALIDETTKEILSFAYISSHFAIGGLTTVDKARRKGYGEFMVKYLSKELIKRDFTPLAFIADRNERSLNLFKKLGFERVGGSNWIVMGN